MTAKHFQLHLVITTISGWENYVVFLYNSNSSFTETSSRIQITESKQRHFKTSLVKWWNSFFFFSSSSLLFKLKKALNSPQTPATQTREKKPESWSGKTPSECYPIKWTDRVLEAMLPECDSWNEMRWLITELIKEEGLFLPLSSSNTQWHTHPHSIKFKRNIDSYLLHDCSCKDSCVRVWSEGKARAL